MKFYTSALVGVIIKVDLPYFTFRLKGIIFCGGGGELTEFQNRRGYQDHIPNIKCWHHVLTLFADSEGPLGKSFGSTQEIAHEMARKIATIHIHVSNTQ